MSTVSKAIAGAIVTALVSLAAKHNFIVNQDIQDSLLVLITAVIGFVGVYVAPKNK